MQKTQVRFLGGKDLLEKEMATPSNILAWEVLWAEESGGLKPMGSQELDRHDLATKQLTYWKNPYRVCCLLSYS